MNKYQFFIVLLVLNFIFISSDESSCFNEAKQDIDSNTLKCYYESIKNKNINFCKEIPYSTFASDIKYEYINNILYNVSCSSSNRKTYPLEKCGENGKSKDNLDDCKKYSNVLNSCCFTEGKSSIYEKGCYWLGTKYEGDIDWANGHFECNSNYLKAKYLFMLFLIFTFIF